MKKIYNDGSLFLAAFTSSVYIIWRIFYTIPVGHGFVSMFFSIGLLIVEIIGFYELLIYLIGMNKIIEPKLPQVDKMLFPDVDVFIATYNEPRELVEKTINGCLLMQYPDASKVHIYLCDDGKRDEMKQLASEYGIGYFSRDHNIGAKAGNLNHAMENTTSPYVVTFDADMIPRHHFLLKTIPYFLEEQQAVLDGKGGNFEKIGFVQTPQSFYNTDLFQYNLYAQDHVPNEQDYFYRNIQLSRNATNTVIYCGSNTVLSRMAINQIGGFYTESITEDFATGILIQAEGYKCIAINEVLASGLSPTDLKSLIKQRERWARGCIQTARRLNIFFNQGLSIKQKLIYSVSILYWYASLKRFFYIMAPILFSVFGVMVLDATLLEVCIFYIPMHIATSFRLKTSSNNIRSSRLTNIYETILSQVLLPKVLLETFGISNDTFSVTRKDKVDNDTKYQWKLSFPFILLAILSMIGSINIIRTAIIFKNFSHVIVLFWLVLNLYSIIMALFFIYGRKQIRSEDRFVAKVPVAINQGLLRFSTNTIDISSSAFSFISIIPHYINPNQTVNATFSMYVGSTTYIANVKAKIIAVKPLDRGYKYSCKIVSISPQDYKMYQAIVFDREPMFPVSIIRLPNPIKDIVHNFNKRKESALPNYRKTIRVMMRYSFVGIDDQIVSVSDCNYTHVVIDKSISEKVRFSISSDLKIFCSLINREKNLYKIDNIDAISSNESHYVAMLDWMQRYKV